MGSGEKLPALDTPPLLPAPEDPGCDLMLKALRSPPQAMTLSSTIGSLELTASLASSVETILPEGHPKKLAAAAAHGGNASSSMLDGRGSEAAARAVTRVGLRRSAMLFRLLSQVPVSVLARELSDCGVDAGNLDQERMIEAVLEQLA